MQEEVAPRPINSTGLCIICNKTFETSLSICNLHYSEIYSELFQLFLKYMKWDCKESNEFNFENEVFPFCHPCKLILIHMYRLHEQAENILKQIQQIVVNVDAIILLSSHDENRNTRGSTGGNLVEDPGSSQASTFKEKSLNGENCPESGKSDNKTECLRRLAINRYGASVGISNDLQKAALQRLAQVEESRRKEIQLVESNPLSGEISPLAVEDAAPNDIAGVVSTENNDCTNVRRLGNSSADQGGSKAERYNHVCTICDKSFEFRRSLNGHMSSHCPPSTGTTVRWEKVGGNKYLFQNEFPVEVVDGKFKCKAGTCPYFARSFKTVRKHVKLVHIEKKDMMIKCVPEVVETSPGIFQYGKFTFEKLEDSKYQCGLCGSIRTSSLSIRAHIRETHIDRGKRYICDVCGKGFKWENNLKDHARIHGQDRPFMCELCGNSFKRHRDLTTHIWCHHRTGGKPKTVTHLCDICGKYFRTKSALADHRNTHTGEKPFKCHWCDKRFGFRTALDIHHKVHKEKQYSCDICGMKFTQSGSVKRHKGTAHKVTKRKGLPVKLPEPEKPYNSTTD